MSSGRITMSVPRWFRDFVVQYAIQRGISQAKAIEEIFSTLKQQGLIPEVQLPGIEFPPLTSTPPPSQPVQPRIDPASAISQAINQFANLKALKLLTDEEGGGGRKLSLNDVLTFMLLNTMMAQNLVTMKVLAGGSSDTNLFKSWMEQQTNMLSKMMELFLGRKQAEEMSSKLEEVKEEFYNVLNQLSGELEEVKKKLEKGEVSGEVEKFSKFLEGLSKLDELLTRYAEQRGISKSVAERAIEELKSEPRGRGLLERIADVIRDIRDIIHGVKPLADVLTGKEEAPPPRTEEEKGELMPRGEELLKEEAGKEEAGKGGEEGSRGEGKPGELKPPKPW